MLCVMPLVLDAKDRDKVGWDKENKGFTFGNKPLSEQKLYRIARSEVERNENKFEKLTTKFVNGNISFEDWQRGMVDETRKAHVNMARLGRGGKENTYANNYLQVGNDLRKTHYPAFRNFAQDVADGKLTEKEIIARSRLYGSATKNSFEKARVSHYEDKPVIARRRLGGCKNHCPECIAYAMRGWGNLKDMIMPGEQCTCRMRCCCSIEIKPTEKK